jgi:hypothetical protein
MWARVIAGVVSCLVGIVWIAQGTNVVHGSGMSGQGQWAVIGAILLAIGVGLLGWAWRIRVPRT